MTKRKPPKMGLDEAIVAMRPAAVTGHPESLRVYIALHEELARRLGQPWTDKDTSNTLDGLQREFNAKRRAAREAEKAEREKEQGDE